MYMLRYLFSLVFISFFILGYYQDTSKVDLVMRKTVKISVVHYQKV